MTEDMMKAIVVYGVIAIQVVTFLILSIYFICKNRIRDAVNSLFVLIPVIGLLLTVAMVIFIYDDIVSRNTASQMIKLLDTKINQLT